MEELQEKRKCKPVGLCSTPPEAEQLAKDGYEKPPRYCVRLEFMWNGTEGVLMEKYNHLREIDAMIRYWEDFLQVRSVTVYKRLDL